MRSGTASISFPTTSPFLNGESTGESVEGAATKSRRPTRSGGGAAFSTCASGGGDTGDVVSPPAPASRSVSRQSVPELSAVRADERPELGPLPVFLAFPAAPRSRITSSTWSPSSTSSVSPTSRRCSMYLRRSSLASIQSPFDAIEQHVGEISLRHQRQRLLLSLLVDERHAIGVYAEPCLRIGGVVQHDEIELFVLNLPACMIEPFVSLQREPDDDASCFSPWNSRQQDILGVLQLDRRDVRALLDLCRRLGRRPEIRRSRCHEEYVGIREHRSDCSRHLFDRFGAENIYFSRQVDVDVARDESNLGSPSPGGAGDRNAHLST